MSTNEDKREFEFIEHPVSLNPSIIKMWVFLEGTARARKLKADVSKIIDLDDFVYVLMDEFKEELKNTRPQNIVFLDNNNSHLQPDTDLQTLAKISTAKKPLIVRYPISSVNLKVTLMWGKKQGKREIPHLSGSLSLLIAYAKEKFDDLQEEEIYFTNDETEILDAYNFNTLVSSQEAQGSSITLKLKVMVKGRKKYSDWRIKDVFKDILRQPDYESLGDLPRLNFDELSPLKDPFTQEEINKFSGELKSHLMNIQSEIENESTARFIINTFLSAVVSHIQMSVNDSVRLGFENELKGSRGYGPVDYVIKIIKIFLIVCEAKLEDMKQGMAQNLAQVHSAVEQQLKSGQAEPKMYGIVTTGKIWRVVRWTGLFDEPVVHISEEYTCNFTGNLEIEKKMIEYIAQILQDQVTTFCAHNNERPSKRLCTRNDK